jgi:hypothetical protein
MVHRMASHLIRFTGHFLFWIFFLSIQWDGLTLYDRAYDLLLDNQAVHILEEGGRDFLTYIKQKVMKAASQSSAQSATKAKEYSPISLE